MAEENIVTISTVADFFSEEYGWIGAHKEYDVRADVADRWISEGKALASAEKNTLILPDDYNQIETPEDNLDRRETATIKRRKNVRS